MKIIERNPMFQHFLIVFEGNMSRINEKIDFLGTDMQWMKNALIEWAKAIDHDDNTNALIEKYCKEDQKRADVSYNEIFMRFKQITTNNKHLVEFPSR